MKKNLFDLNGKVVVITGACKPVSNMLALLPNR